jgi:hypothetical protein
MLLALTTPSSFVRGYRRAGGLPWIFDGCYRQQLWMKRGSRRRRTDTWARRASGGAR